MTVTTACWHRGMSPFWGPGWLDTAGVICVRGARRARSTGVFGDVRCDDRLETACWQRGMSPFMRSCKAGYGGINLCPRRRATCYLLQGVVRRAPLLSASRVLVRADHSGELQRGRRECFDEQVIDIRGDDLRGGAFGLSFGRVARMTHVVCHRDRMLSALGSYMYRSRDVPDLTRRMPHVS